MLIEVCCASKFKNLHKHALQKQNCEMLFFNLFLTENKPNKQTNNKNKLT